MNIEKAFLKTRDSANAKLKVGIASLLMLGGVGAKAQQMEVPKNISEKIENVIKIEKNTEEMSPEDLYEFYSPSQILDSLPKEEFQKIKFGWDKKQDGTPEMPAIKSPYFRKIKDIEEKGGIKDRKILFPSDFKSKEEFIDSFIKNFSEYQNKVGKQIEDFKNKYFKGKHDYYLKLLSKIQRGELKKGSLILDEFYINSFMNFQFDADEMEDFKDELINFIENYEEDGNWRRYDYNKSDQELKDEAEEIWEMDQKIQKEKKDKTEQNPPQA